MTSVWLQRAQPKFVTSLTTSCFLFSKLHNKSRPQKTQSETKKKEVLSDLIFLSNSGWAALTSCTRHQAARGSPRWGPLDLKFQAVAGLHVTSRQPCWQSRTKAFVSSGNLTPFSCKFFEKNFYCIDHQHTTNMAALSRGCKPRVLDENFIGLEIYLEAEISMRRLPLYNLFVGEKKKKTVILEWTSLSLYIFFYPQYARLSLGWKSRKNIIKAHLFRHPC